MTGGIWSGGIVIAVAVGLWLVYLVPTWLRRQEYLATERNAVRLQQTLRVLAETSEMPEEVRVEATARGAAAQERILRKARQRAEAKARAEAEAKAAAIEAEAAARKLRKPGSGLRRARAATSLVLLVALLACGYGVFELVTLGSWLMLVVGGGVIVVAVIVQARLARAGRRRRVARPQTAAVTASELYDVAETDGPAPEARPTWTPRPLPKPLYLSRGTMAANTMASADAAEELRRAAAEAELNRRAAELEPEVARFRPRRAEPEPTTEPIAIPRTAGSPFPEPVEGPFSELVEGAAALSTPPPELVEGGTATPSPLPELGPTTPVPDEAKRRPAVPVGSEESLPEPVEGPAASALPPTELAKPRPSSRPATRYATMGVVTEAEKPAIDLDAALRRRRAG